MWVFTGYHNNVGFGLSRMRVLKPTCGFQHNVGFAPEKAPTDEDTQPGTVKTHYSRHLINTLTLRFSRHLRQDTLSTHFLKETNFKTYFKDT